MDDDTRMSLESVFREEHGRLLATLVGRYGDLELAEEVTSDAIEAALERWPIDGVPSKPGAWLLTTARRRALDRLRRDTTYAARLAALHVEQERSGPAPSADTLDAELPDDRLQLFFTCAHPALNSDDRIALTLRCLAHLSTGEVARAFVIPNTTAGQRISRAKNKIRTARIPFRVPGADELPERLPCVLQVLYSIYTEGYRSSSGHELMRTDLAEEAIRLTRILHSLMPGEREVTGLLALMLAHHARRNARCDRGGAVVMLDAQDRDLWDRAMVTEAVRLTERSLTGGPPGPYGVQAAIATLHVEPDDPSETDWAQIVALYDVLHTIAPSPFVSLNRAAAIAMADGPSMGLELLDELSDVAPLQNYSPYHAARGDLLERLGRTSDAATCFRTAADCAGSEPEREYLRRRADAARHENVPRPTG